MEGVSANFYRTCKGYLRRKRYQRLNGSTDVSRRRRVGIARLGGERKRRGWRIKLAPKLRFKMPSPKKLLIRLRDAYVNMMLGLTNSRGLSGAISAGFGGHSLGYGGRSFASGGAVSEYDEKVMIAIYKTFSQGALMPNTARPTDIVCSR